MLLFLIFTFLKLQCEIKINKYHIKKKILHKGGIQQTK